MLSEKEKAAIIDKAKRARLEGWRMMKLLQKSGNFSAAAAIGVEYEAVTRLLAELGEV